MIDLALDYVKRELSEYLAISADDVHLEHPHVLKEKADLEGVFVSLVNIEEEKTTRNAPPYIRTGDALKMIEPPINLNLYLLFAFKFKEYDTGLIHLSKTVERFQGKKHYSAENQSATNPMPAGIKRLIFDHVNLNFEELNHLWGVLGGAYFPSVLYKVRLISIQADLAVDEREIKEIRIDGRITR